jgi:hypothetical protein
MASTNIQTFPGKVGVSNTNPIHTLDIGSNVYIDDTAQTKLRIIGNIHASGVTVDGTITAIDSENLSVKDPIILLASGSTGTSDTGIIMKRADGDSNVAVFYDEGVGLKIGHTLSTAQDIHISVDSSNSLSTSIYGPVTVAHSSAQALVVQGGAEIADDFKVGASKLFVDVSESNVGIGTNAPLATLDVHGTANVGALTATSISGPLSGNADTATALETARTIGGVSFDGSGNIDLPGVNTAGTQNTSGNAATATALETARTIGGVSFDGTANIDLPGVNTSGNQDTTGNATTATALETARTIGGVSFDGTANIDLPGVNTSGNQDTTGNATTATALETARTIGGVSFDGSGNIDLPGVNTAGNQNTSGNAATATALETARTIGGVSFDGSGNIDLPGVNTSGNQDTTGNADTATTATNQSGGTVSATTGTFSGNVGIGTASPIVPLHVSSSNFVSDAVGPASSSNNVFRVTSTDVDSTLLVGASDTGSYISSFSKANFANEKNLILNANGGNVGIGVTSPTYKLDMNGSIRFNTSLVSTSSTQRLWTSGSSTNWIQFQTGGTSGNHILDIQANDGNCVLSSRSTTPLLLNPSSGGDVGIGDRISCLYSRCKRCLPKSWCMRQLWV